MVKIGVIHHVWRLAWIVPLESQLGGLRLRRGLRLHIHLASPSLGFVHLDLILGRPGDYTSAVRIKLGPVPRTLHRAAHEGSIGQRSTLVGAVIFKSDYSLGTASNHDALVADAHQHHLAFAQFALVAGWPAPALEFALLPLPGIGIAVIHADLVAVGKGPAEPAADPEQDNAHGH